MAIAVSTEAAVPRINVGFVVLIAAGAALGGFLFGFDSAVINGAVPGIQATFAASSAVTGFAAISLFFVSRYIKETKGRELEQM